ncbi:hypothetical protein SERLA73DRAFT_132702 [Serpula lacrymans var. lacrymans S7.3]|uniref:Uncharacterized protein n=2 Tax=Serpula lacrymans var. lacrymans TaxID=341189 RepID=F8PPA4_SERL3|nr:uncharacterized protein SERLADRAFT_406649 [Serpula lacrymans var. lacrymans S7.9]EGO01981.1 hypothetical protein SERLA73DRAFT_132702 [Serpula lacrymans var. lacrymans S7.3]EGO27605.1 hypothetical protein SERLADRAFT_406649 [Serpula lacrymans var. lacrymans S7.9]
MSSISRTQKVFFSISFFSHLSPLSPVKSFNGCGYCRWARANPQIKSVYHNPGWPGCCRPPAINEQHYIHAADWPSVSIVHHVPIPAEIKSLLDSLMPKGNSLPVGTIGRSAGAQASKPALDRRNSCTNQPVRSNSRDQHDRAQSLSIAARGRPGGSPPQQSSTLGPNSRSPGAPSSLPNSNFIDQYLPQRRHNSDPSEKSRSSPVRKNVELEGSVSRRNTAGRASLSSALSSMKASEEAPRQSSLSRSASTSSTTTPPLKPSTFGTRERQNTVTTRVVPKKSTVEEAMAAMEIASNSSSGSSDSGSSGSRGSGSLSDATIISDGGFTDYLSDESEAELQRQAEAKAALVAQNQAEELEFKAARQQLAGVGLHPPKSWNDTNDGVPRIQGTPLHAPYTHHAPFAPTFAHTGPTTSRG